MHRLTIFAALCALIALVGCSAEKTDSLSVANPHSQAAASLAGGGRTELAPAPLTPNHLAKRPPTQPFVSPAQTDSLPLWPPTTQLPQTSPPTFSGGTPAISPATQGEVPPLFPANPPPFPMASAPANDAPQSQFTPALPGVDPPAAAPLVDDANPLRGSDPTEPLPAVPQFTAPQLTAPLPTATPAPSTGNPLRLNSADATATFPTVPSAAPTLPDNLLPSAPVEQPAAVSPPPAPITESPATQIVPQAPAATEVEVPATESPPQLAELPKPFPKITVKPAPSRLPRVPINPQAHAEWSAKQKLAAASLDPSGGSAQPSDYDPAAYGTPPTARMLTMGTKQDPPETSPAFSFNAPGSPEAAPAEPLEPPSPEATQPVPPSAAPTADVPTFAPPSFAPAAAEAAPNAAAPEEPLPIIPVPEVPTAASEAPPATSELPNFTAPSFEPAAAEPPIEPAAADPMVSTPAPATAPRPETTAIVPSTSANDPFDVVRVFYGTDRLPELVNRDTLVMRLIRFTPAAVLIGLAVIGVGVVLVSRKPTWIIGTTAFLIFSALAVWHGISETIEIANLAAQEEPRYSAEKSDRGRIDRGICEVSIPKTHDPGELEGPSITRLEFESDPRKHITLRKTVRLQTDAFYEQLRAQVASSPNRELLVFVHGFNVSFEDAARRTAQMAHDLKLQGAPVFFSWPADKYFLLTYGKDETSVSWSAPHLKEFLLDLVHHTDARAINLVGHSMGNRALTTALREIDLQLRNEARLFNQVVLAAPDIDADDFRDNIAPAIQRTAKQVTLYASSNDIALGASRLLHRNARAGDTSRGLVLVPGMVTIDVSNINGGPWGHSYYGASDPVLRDLHLLLTSLPPERRTWLNMKELDGQTYWAFKPLGSSATAPAIGTPR